jgi:hypothetical protein
MDSSKSNFSRLAATTIIWAFATGMVGITNRTVIVPLAIVLGAAGSTVAVWKFSKSSSREQLISSGDVQALQQRITNLETICSSELDVQRRFKQLESSQQDKNPDSNQSK